MKKPFAAFLLSFLLPGAGLEYLGKRKWAWLNLGIVVLINLIACFLLSAKPFDPNGRIIWLVCAAGSGCLADLLVRRHNKRYLYAEIAHFNKNRGKIPHPPH